MKGVHECHLLPLLLNSRQYAQSRPATGRLSETCACKCSLIRRKLLAKHLLRLRAVTPQSGSCSWNAAPRGPTCRRFLLKTTLAYAVSSAQTPLIPAFRQALRWLASYGWRRANAERAWAAI